MKDYKPEQIASIFSAIVSILSLLTLVGGGAWYAAKLDTATKSVPKLIQTQHEYGTQIAVLQDQQKYTDMHYAEIMKELTEINRKLDRRGQ